ncbi:MAG: dihydropyrimidine dehydrogenase (NAD+), partial [Streblomastix strix]
MSAVDVPASVKKPTCLRTTTCHKIDQCYYFRGLESVGTDRNRDFHYPKHLLSVSEAVKEGQRCLKCLDPPCQSSCPSQIDVRTFNNAIG